jgi:hypothetical protein
MAMSSKGRQRLSVLLCGLSGTTCAVLMTAFVLFYGAPYNPMWWWVMAAILAAATLLPLCLVPAIEWVMAGYRGDRNG